MILMSQIRAPVDMRGRGNPEKNQNVAGVMTSICKTGEAFWAFQSVPERPEHSETLGTPAQFYRCLIRRTIEATNFR